MYKTEYDGSRIYVGLSSHGLYITAFQSLGTKIVGYASPRSLCLNYEEKRQSKIYNVSCEGRIISTAMSMTYAVVKNYNKL